MSITIGSTRRNTPMSIIIISIFIMFFGILLIFLNAMELNRGSNWVETNATISNIVVNGAGKSVTNDVYVDYVFKDISYTDKLLNTYESSMYIGKSVIIRCNPLNPEEIIYGSQQFFITLFIIGGCLILGAILIPTIYFFTLYRKANRTIASESNKTFTDF